MRPQLKREENGMWWDRAWSLVDGCTPVSRGCAHCWSMEMAHRFGRVSEVRFREDRLELPLRTRKPTVWAVWNDLFHETVTYRQIHATLGIALSSPRHLFLILTKRPELCRSIIALPPNVWIGTSVEDQATADERIPQLLRVQAALRFVSYEPALGPVDFSPYLGKDKIGWLIAGGETGPRARPCNPEWLWEASDQCEKSRVQFWWKSYGSAHREKTMFPFGERREFPEVAP